MTNSPNSISSWSPVVAQILAGSESAVEELYKSLRPIQCFLRLQCGPDRAADAYQELIIKLIGAIQTGTLRKPEALFAYAMAIARGITYQQIKEAIRERHTLDVECVVGLACDPSQSPEQLVLRSERIAIAKRVLAALPHRKREMLIRFYLDGESEEEIRRAMGMSHNQFRLNKSRAKTLYEALMQQAMTRVPN